MKSPNFQFDTDRQHDVSLARLLKNWSNRYTPPEDSRQKLLDAAAMTQPQQKMWWYRRVFKALNWKASLTKGAMDAWLPVYDKTGYKNPKLPFGIHPVTVENYFLQGLIFRLVW